MELTPHAGKPTTNPEMATKLKLKLLVDQRSNCVVLAEAGKDVVDLLFSLLQLPLGSVTRLLSKDLEAAGSTSMLGSIGTLYDSVEAFVDDAYFIHSTEGRLALVNPQAFSPTPSLESLLLKNVPSSARPAKNYYCCSVIYRDCRFVTDASGTPCPSCGEKMTREMKFVANAEGGGGYVKELVTYMVMDDLSVTPMSNITAIAMLNKLNVKDVSSLYEWNVELGMKEGLDLLKASLNSRTVLTDVFLGKSKSGVPVD